MFGGVNDNVEALVLQFEQVDVGILAARLFEAEAAILFEHCRVKADIALRRGLFEVKRLPVGVGQTTFDDKLLLFPAS